MGESINMETKLYQKKWFVILMLVIFAPVGIMLMFTQCKWKKSTKIMISIVSIIWCLIIIISIGNGESVLESFIRGLIDGYNGTK